nr:MAG TPA: hypothetical protein [Caudoviricetes sp.]
MQMVLYKSRLISMPRVGKLLVTACAPPWKVFMMNYFLLRPLLKLLMVLLM